jgi:RNA polymerase sigma-70 factor (ECF subfamily)
MQARLEDLYARYGQVVYARCKRILGEGASAEDAVQEVFIRAFKNMERFDDEVGALKWLYRVSTNYCLNQLRNQKLRLGKLADLPRPVEPSPERALLDRDLVQRLIVRMPDKLQGPVMLYYLDDMDQQKVAEVLGISRRTVINRLNDFLERARKILAREGATA